MEQALENILKLRKRILAVLNGKIEEFSLAGGTALSLFYFKHRESFDLDFFVVNFSEKRVMDIISEISKSTGIKIDLIKKREVKDGARMIVCFVPVDENRSLRVDEIKRSLKLDFIEDVYRSIPSQSNIVNGVSIMSKENIYLRKIYAAFGVTKTEEETGKELFLGGRQEAKDIFDLYYLSQTFMPLSKFMKKYCNQDEKTSAVIWHRRYDRIRMKSELLDIITDKEIDCSAIEKHFNLEIETIIKQMAGEL